MATSVMIIDGQGGKIGRLLIMEIKKKMPSLYVLAIGTNSIATASMLKAGADAGATGENPVLVGCENASIIAGPLGIISANSLLGEITPLMAQAIGKSNAKKILLPVSKCHISVVGIKDIAQSELIKEAVDEIIKSVGGEA